MSIPNSAPVGRRAGARQPFTETLRLDPANKSARSYLAAVGK